MVLMDLFSGKEWRHRHREWTWAHSEGGREWDDGKYIYTLPGINRITCEKMLCSTGSPVWSSVRTWGVDWGRGGLGKEGMCVYLRLIHVVIWQKLTQHYKN